VNFVVRQDLSVAPLRYGTPLHWACQRGFVELVRLLLANGADANGQNSDGQSPLVVAIHAGGAASAAHLEVISILLDAGADVNCDTAADGTGTPLHFAAEQGNLSLMRRLLHPRDGEHDPASCSRLNRFSMSPLMV
jgi:ankyrin repeat protein